MESLQLDKKVIIHVCTELVIIGGITFWLNNKINNQDTIIAELKKENEKLAARIAKIENFLLNATGSQPAPAETPAPPPSGKKKKKKQQSPTGSEESIVKSEEHDIDI
jgi:hypothetical protein